MRTTVVGLVATLTVAVGSAPGAAASAPNPCLIMDKILVANSPGLTEKFFDVSGGGGRCEWDTPLPPGQLQAYDSALLYVFHERSATYAKGDYDFLLSGESGQGCERTRIKGANAACVKYLYGDEGQPLGVRIVWRRGRYVGWFVKVGIDSGFAAEGVHELKRFLRRMPR
jgi:hypothetical protein